MASVAQIEANRLNAQKSTGPRTPEGKERASRNAVKHGLLAEQVVIHGEDPAEFDGYRDRMLGELAPVGEVETMLAERAVSLAWRLRRAERLQSAVFARVYRENADDVVLWPKHGLPIAPGPDEEEVILGQVVMADFGHAKVLDRLVVYERRIEGSFYRTMAELRRERQARMAEEGQASRRAGTPAAKPCPTFPSHGRVAEEGARTPTTGELGSFGMEEKRTPYGVTTNGNHGQDARATEEAAELGSFDMEEKRTPDGVATNGDHGRDARATEEAAELGSFDMEAKRTPDGVTTSPPTCGNHGRDARATGTPGKLGSFGADAMAERTSDAKRMPDGVTMNGSAGGMAHPSSVPSFDRAGGDPEMPVQKHRAKRSQSRKTGGVRTGQGARLPVLSGLLR